MFGCREALIHEKAEQQIIYNTYIINVKKYYKKNYINSKRSKKTLTLQISGHFLPTGYM